MTAVATSQINNGSSQGSAVSVQFERPFGVLIDPSGWTGTQLTFDVSFDQKNWYPLRNPDDDSERVLLVRAAAYYWMDPAWLAGAVAWRPRSGTFAAPVVQLGTRVLTFSTLGAE